MPEQSVDFVFPTLGVSVAGEVGTQPEGTTPRAVNVRVVDPIEERRRGGSRPGWSRLVNARVNGNAPIQHLALLVSTSYLSRNTDSSASEGGVLLPPVWSSSATVTDPSTNNNAAGLGDRNPLPREVRVGGSGRQPVRVGTATAAFCRTYHVSGAFQESYTDFTICTTYSFPYDFSNDAVIDFGSSGFSPLIAPGPSVPTLARVNTIIDDAGGPTATIFDDYTDVPS